MGNHKATGVIGAGLALLLVSQEVEIGQPLRLVLLWLMVMSGPLSGWLVAVRIDALLSALELLIPVTALVAVPFAVYSRRPEPGWLGFGVLLWICTGWLFAVGIWI